MLLQLHQLCQWQHPHPLPRRLSDGPPIIWLRNNLQESVAVCGPVNWNWYAKQSVSSLRRKSVALKSQIKKNFGYRNFRVPGLGFWGLGFYIILRGVKRSRPLSRGVKKEYYVLFRNSIRSCDIILEIRLGTGRSQIHLSTHLFHESKHTVTVVIYVVFLFLICFLKPEHLFCVISSWSINEKWIQ